MSDYDDDDAQDLTVIFEGEEILDRKQISATDWLKVARAMQSLHASIFELTELKGGDPKFMRDKAYRAGFETASQKFPHLAALIKATRKRRDINWLANHSEALSRWLYCQPQIEVELAYTGPRIIRSLYYRVGVDWHPTKEQMAKLTARQAEQDREDRERGEKLQVAIDVLSVEPPGE